ARTFEELLGCFARLIAGGGPADELANRADALRVLLEPVHLVDRMWEAVQVMVDDRLPRAWTSVHRAYQLGRLGLPRIADHVLVGLGVSRTLDSDPVDEAVRRDAFQRRAVDLAWTIGGAIAGRVGDHGVVFLSAATGGAERKCQKLRDLADRAALLARREFGLSLHFGASIAPGAVPLSRSYQAALAAAESALVAGEKIRFAEPGAKRSPHSLGHLRKELIRGLEERPGLLGARFERYLEAVATQSGYQVDLARGHLEAGFERAAETLVESGALEQKGLDTLLDTLTRAATGARTLSDLLAAYRRAAADLADALQHPAAARQDRSLRLALEHIHQHYTEPLRLAQVARLSGFAPKYFSRLFSERENKPFELYVLGLRLERAKHLLSSTDLDIGRVAKLAGFASAQYFCRVFRRDLGRTPRQYRRLREYPAARTRRHSTTKK
ncbi:MAG TPA: AraC family transcriptional regulator, partial [Polyangiaceae bacterium]|nr:AraC family transcriptional regulator [Polyangiaceae bacterium]